MAISYSLETFVLEMHILSLGIQSWHWLNHLISLILLIHFLILATADLVCDPSCTGNKVCQNYSGDPECVCADGFTGEDICKGILDSFSTYLNNYLRWKVLLYGLSLHLNPIVNANSKTLKCLIFLYVRGYQGGVYMISQSVSFVSYRFIVWLYLRFIKSLCKYRIIAFFFYF